MKNSNKTSTKIFKKKLMVADRSLSRFINEMAIVQAIRQSQGISRADLAKGLGISKPAVAANVEILLQMGLVEERGEGTVARKGGRKPILLYLNEKYRYLGALDLSFREPVCAVADLSNRIIGLKRVKISAKANEDERRESVRKTFIEILQENDIPEDKLDTLVICHPGVFSESEDPEYVNQRHQRWSGIGLKDYLKDAIAVHIHTRNDVNLAALGEWYSNLEEHQENLLYVSSGIGLGAAIIIDQKLYRGEQNAAGEIADLMLNNGENAEDYIAMDGLLKRVKEAKGMTSMDSELSFSELIELLQAKDEAAGKVVYEIGITLGRVIYNCCVVLNIRKVLLGGEYLELGETLLKGIEDAIAAARGINKPKVAPSELGEVAGIYGCFVVGNEKLIDRHIQMV